MAIKRTLLGFTDASIARSLADIDRSLTVDKQQAFDNEIAIANVNAKLAIAGAIRELAFAVDDKCIP